MIRLVYSNYPLIFYCLTFLVVKPHYFCTGLSVPPSHEKTLSQPHDLLSNPSLNRRLFVASVPFWAIIATTAGVSPSSAATSTSYSERLEQDKLNLPAPSYASELNGVDNTYFPPFLAGTWNVTQTLVSVKTPLGIQFAGGPNGDIQIAQSSIDQMITQQLDKPVQLQLRYIPTKWGVAEDRLFNTRQRLDAFAGRAVVASVEYANVGGSNRASVLAMGGQDTDPLQTTMIRFKGPAAQKTFVVSHGSSSTSSLSDSSVWSGYELQRSIFALTNQNTAPPITTDSELIWEFQPTTTSDTIVQGRLRIAEYLNAQNDKLYFEAGKRAVTLQDYTLVMTKVSE
ncbi:expressed unknown protein [Seminavis robusta]|uniref:DUF6816 domain-containing protein n=1 Tax=Seminavis robusta TaxID=568900 RepID=A0A9N8H5V4_9STRA|nr:expressed unknown protein [Seminavis robusta]|eukprot:Sro31_g020430.1 n/a (341) ;mRNA; f:127808-128830